MRLVILVAAGIVAWAVAWAVSRNAGRLGLVAAPNNRSSHAKPTPTGGGIGILVAGTMAGAFFVVESGLGGPILVAGVVMGVLGLLDDLRNLAIRVRIGVHAIVVLALIWTVGMPPWVVDAGWIAQPAYAGVMLLAGVWWINLFNFMDGIDGIAGSEAVRICLGAAALAFAGAATVTGDPMWWLLLAVAAAAIGFLTLNWPPARIFMGDAGSNYLAAVLFGLMLYATSAGWLGYAAWAILPALFVADATVTLLRRMATGQQWAAAHRQHAYQRLARRWAGHQQVTLLYLGIGVAWLLPLAWLAQAFAAQAWVFVLLAYAPLVVGVYVLGAGMHDEASAAH